MTERRKEMSISIGSCGHRLLNGGHCVSVKDYDKEGKRAVSIRYVCLKCKIVYKKQKLILKNKKQEDKWLDTQYD